MKPQAHVLNEGHEQWSAVLRSADDTVRLGEAIGQAATGGEVVALHGPVGAGKTTLVRGIARGLGIDSTTVVSPTFTLIQAYEGRRLPLIHADFYRLHTAAEVRSLGLDEYVNGVSVVVIEWPDKAPETLPQDRLTLSLTHRTARTRHVQLQAYGPTSRQLLAGATTQYKRASRDNSRRIRSTASTMAARRRMP